MENPVICLTFDLEEFDLPAEYQRPVSESEQMQVTLSGMRSLLPLLDEFDARCTFFTTANFALQNRELIRELSLRHEIASHSFFHSSFEIADLGRSKQVLEEITALPVTGFRMPRMRYVDYNALRAAGYRYDSSLHPTWIPGRYNHFFSERRIHRSKGLTVFPASVTPLLRAPLFWLAFKNLPAARYTRWLNRCLKHDGYANLYMHPWEFADLSAYKLPEYIAKDPQTMVQKLRAFLAHFSPRARFIPVIKLLHERNEV
jgi:peptidoglycan/xylan/chitin deacetylase (PgdA/CDA1 family)